MLTPCTACGCSWDADGFYHSNGELVQPCKVCRCDTASIYYTNNAEVIREKKRQSYYDNLDSKREYYRTYRQSKRSQPAA